MTEASNVLPSDDPIAETAIVHSHQGRIWSWMAFGFVTRLVPDQTTKGLPSLP